MMIPNKIDHEEGPPCPILVRQGSQYNSLSLDDINNNLGKPHLNVMNLDDLVKINVIASDHHQHQTDQLMQNPSSSASAASAPSSSSSSSSSASTQAPTTTCPGNTNARTKWNSNPALLSTLSTKKTIDEVWNEIVVDQESDNVSNSFNLSSCRRGLTLGETTLEEFLIRAGVLSLGNQESVTTPHPFSVFNHPMVLVKQHQGGTEWGVQFQMEPTEDQNQNPLRNIVHFPVPIHQVGLDPEHHFQVPCVIRAGGGFQNHQVADAAGYLDRRLELAVGLPDTGERNNAPSDPQVELEINSQYATTGEPVERSILRRQRRMIKNRESAARSRARKQVE